MQTILTATAEFSVLEKDLFICRMLENAHVDVADVDENHNAVLELASGRRYAVLVDACTTTTITKEAMEHAARPESYKLLIAQAIVVNSLPNRLVGNFIIKFHKPASPTKLFSDIPSAHVWLRQCMEEERTGVKKRKKHLSVF
jgi:hypothetical protein